MRDAAQPTLVKDQADQMPGCPGDGSAVPSRPKKLIPSGPLRRRVRSFARELRVDPEWVALFRNDPKRAREMLLRLVKKQFPLRLGRPPDPQIDAACRMVANGSTVPAVLRKQIADWDKLDPYARMLLGKGLHQAIGRRVNPRKKRIRQRPR